MKIISSYRFVFYLSLLLVLLPGLAQAKNPYRIYPDTLSYQKHELRLCDYWQTKRQTLGLAMSGGGARGIAQIGVLKAFEENNIPVDAVVGTSIGAIIGGLYSSGYSAKEIEQISLAFNWDYLTSFSNAAPRNQVFLEQKRVRDRAAVSLRFDGLKLKIPKSLSAAQNLTTSLDLLSLSAPYHPIRSFSSLKINYRAVATDLLTGKRVIISKGSLSTAMRASATVPLLFMPVEIDGLELVDGGLVSNLPVDVLDSLDVDIKVALNTMGTLYHTTQDLNLPWKTADQVIGILMIKQNNLQLEQADVVISPQLGTHESAEFTKLDSLIEKGYQAGLLVADSLKALVYDHAFSESLLTGDFQPELSSVAMLSDSLRNRFMKIILEHKQPKACLHHLLKTDLLKKAYAEIDTLKKTITYKIELLPAIAHLQLNGPQYGLTQKLQTCFLPLLNQPYTNWQAGACLEKAIKIYRQAGHPLTQYEAIDISEDTLKLRFSENRPSDIRINRSRKSTVPAIIERELNFDTTHVLKPEKVKESIQALYNMNIFDRINMWPNYSIDSLNRLSSSMVVNINERFSEILRFGFRFDNTYNSQFMLDFRNENFLGRAIELGGWTSVGSRIFNTQVEFRVHRLWDTYLTFFSTLFYNNRHVFVYDIQFATLDNNPKRQRIGDYGQQFYGLRTAIGGQVLRDGQATLEFQLQKAKVYPDDFKIQRESSTFKTLRSRFLVDSRNEPFEAKSGTVLDIYYDFTPEFLGNRFSFSRLFFSFQENTPITSSFRYRLSLNLGIADNRTPLSHQFSMGGVEPLYSIPFYGFYMDDFRGRQVINVGLDFTMDSPLQFVFPTSFSLHYSVGNMWNELSAVKLETLYHGFGTELSLKTPLGPARLILSKAVLSDETNNSNRILFGPTVFHFVLGYQF